MSLAWHVAMLSRRDLKKFPKHDSLMVKVGRKERVRQTPEQMLAMCKVMAGIAFPEMKSKKA